MNGDASTVLPSHDQDTDQAPSADALAPPPLPAALIALAQRPIAAPTVHEMTRPPVTVEAEQATEAVEAMVAAAAGATERPDAGADAVEEPVVDVEPAVDATDASLAAAFAAPVVPEPEVFPAPPVPAPTVVDVFEAEPLVATVAEPVQEEIVPDAPRRRRGLPKISFVLFAAVAAAALLLGVVALSNLGELNNAREDRTSAEAQLEVTEATSSRLAEENAALIESEGQLEERVSELESDLTQAEQVAVDAEDVVAAVPAVDVTALEDEITELETSNGELLERATSAEAEAEALFLDAVNPTFMQFVGETLAGGGVRALSATEAQCFGTAVVAQIGPEAVGAGFNRDRTTATNNVLVEAMGTAATECGLSRADVLGS